mmetsp:Transcript_19072/g.34088  ORF Transcript_19072/g.34088 Transcript_19072/m.34088 type:complete len:246 (+) Transcript_19072:72-809(+)|eukprot:CAMPEP_0197516086 /NCGR_PEP_ID=MMETSP1318-20131121/982_1 /TAXON_ID=552666 /ORGANISM="Partenskyella glossopodia, Strain RCC365" /LENGTH=245 /DNA_ID=CAMNT_0043064603 /DNA_START=30 /DNA_END=767 /DNA_ORIENTATION=+
MAVAKEAKKLQREEEEEGMAGGEGFQMAPCYRCGEPVGGLQTFMYADHEFCTEHCRAKQIKLDTQMEQTAALTHKSTDPLINTCHKYRQKACYLPAKITTYDGTLLMRELRIRTIIARLEHGFERKDLVNRVTAGLLRSVTVHCTRIFPVLMLFKTNTTMEIMTCNPDEIIPEGIQDIELAPMLLLRGKRQFRSKHQLREQLQKFDVGAKVYLEGHSKLVEAINKPTCTHQCETTCASNQACLIL